MSGNLPLSVSIIITTRNRKEELRTALRSAFAQTARPEVVVMDDGSSDGTAEMVRAEFPKAVLHHVNESKGYVVRRNEGARCATGDVIFSIDDDAEFSTSQVVEQALREFDNPRIGAVAIPYIEPHKDNRLMQRAPDPAAVWITDRFIGTAHAVRHDVFLKLGGYREHLVHQGEESDYCIRMLNAGYVVRMGCADPIKHWESPKRDFRRMDYYGHRNNIFFAWTNIPAFYLLPHLAGATLGGIWNGCRVGRLAQAVKGLAAGWNSCLSGVVPRRPVSLDVYRMFRQLKKRGPVPISALKNFLESRPN